MPSYIERDALYEKTAKWENLALQMVEQTATDGDITEWRKWSAILAERSAFKFDVADAPAADVQPVVHGKWIPVTNGRGGSECNVCHAYAPSLQSGAEYKSHFCPNCGARMDVEVKQVGPDEEGT
jgi:hypothetical protein